MLAHFATHLLSSLPIPLLPFIRTDFNLDYTQSALVVSVFSLANGFAQIPAGWLADRFGPRILLTVGIIGLALVAVLIGLSHTYIMMVALLVLLGILAGTYHPSATPLISASVEPKNRGRAMGTHMIGGSGGLLLAPIIAAAIATVWGWRYSFIALAVPVAIFGIIFYQLLTRQTRQSQASGSVASPYGEPPPPPHRWRRLVAFLILSVISGTLIYAVTPFVPLYLVDQFGVSKQTAATILSIQHSAGLWAGPLGGYLSDRLGRIPVMLVTCLVAGFAIYFLSLAPNFIAICAIVLVIGATVYIRFPVSEAFIIGETTVRNRSTIYGMFYFAMQETNAIIAPIVGLLIDRFGFHSTFTILSLSVVAITLVCGVFLRGNRD